MAGIVPCPPPVAASDPYRSTRMAATSLSKPLAARSSAKRRRGAHRSHGMRAGRPDPDAEQVEHADRHDLSSGIADRDGAVALGEPVYMIDPMGTSGQPRDKRGGYLLDAAAAR